MKQRQYSLNELYDATKQLDVCIDAVNRKDPTCGNSFQSRVISMTTKQFLMCLKEMIDAPMNFEKSKEGCENDLLV